MNEDEMTVFPVAVVCRTSECSNSGETIEMLLPDVNMRVICGVCSKDISDKKIA